jgi:hypothetical protein
LSTGYRDIQKEETLKAQVYKDWFEKFGYNYEPDIGNIDFVITEPLLPEQKSLLPPRHFLWAEAKRGSEDVFTMLTQLVLTCRKTYEYTDELKKEDGLTKAQRAQRHSHDLLIKRKTFVCFVCFVRNLLIDLTCR